MLNFHPFPSLDTPRLHLRQLMHKDAPNIFALRSDDSVNKYLDRPPTTTPEEAKAFIDKINAAIANNQSLYWAVCLPYENELIGTICLWNFSEDQTTAETGYELSPAFQGRGVMNEALQAVLSYSRDVLHLKNIEAFTHRDNAASLNLLEKTGFKQEKERKDPDGENNLVLVLRF